MAERDLFRHTHTDDPTTATLAIDLDTRGERIEPMLFGKFCEHLGNNIYNGMEAQILFNPTFGEWHFRAAERRRSGGFVSETDPERVREQVEAGGRPLAYPEETDPGALLAAYNDGLAFGWLPTDGAVEPSPDTGPSGNRAQRLEIGESDGGIRQQTSLPLHRTRGYEFRCKARATAETTLGLEIRPAVETGGEPSGAVASESVALSPEWETIEGTLELADDIDPDGVYNISLTTPDPAEVVVERVLLYPDDHADYADTDVVRLLRESDLPLLRWPGGNFVSGYDWRDGVGPVDERPTKPNPAWGGLEYNFFGTHEFMAFCEHIGCEPSLCVNAGDGTPEEAAAWVEYCNGSVETDMGALRAENGHPEPYDVTYWEVGNELYGKWQVSWTTPAGNADRYRRFREAMLDADPEIKVTACGLETNSDGGWNSELLERCGEDVRAISEHVLGGGQVDADTDPDELYHAFMGFADQLGEEFRDLHERMRAAGVEEPKLDVTELQLFATFEAGAEGAGREAHHETDDTGGEDGLTSATMPTPTTISEALYDATVRHEFIRMGNFVEMLTHSATVNHGGGLRKKGERVWANPCHYGRAMGTALANETPVGVKVACDSISTETSFREIEPVDDVSAVDAMAAVDDDASELVLVVLNRRCAGDPIELTVDTGAFDAASEATATTLSGETMYAANTREDPERIVPEVSSVAVEDGLTLDLAPYSMVRVTVPRTE